MQYHRNAQQTCDFARIPLWRSAHFLESSLAWKGRHVMTKHARGYQYTNFY